MKLLASSCLVFVLSLRVSAVELLAYDNAQSQPGEALGIAALARELAADAACLTRRVVAKVSNVSKRDAPDIQKHRWTNSYTNIEMVDHPCRVSFNLSISLLGRAFETGPFTVIEWTTDYAGNINASGQPAAFGHRFSNHQEAVMPKPLTDQALISFVPPLQDKDGSLTKSNIVLPGGALDELAAAIAWRSLHLEMFKAKNKASDDVIQALRAELSNANTFRRLIAMVQLMHLGKLGETGVEIVLKSCANPLEIAATTILIITDAPELVTAITDELAKPEANRQLFDGVAMGAATHFLNLPDSELLLRKAQSYQIVRTSAPNPPDVLKATVSFPLLLKLADSIDPKGVQSKREASSMLFKLLKASAVLPRQSDDHSGS